MPAVPSIPEPEPEFRVDASRVDGQAVVRPVGDVDLATGDRLHGAIVEALADGPQVLTVDLGEVTFLDSTGLRTLLQAQELARRDGVRLLIAPGPARVQRVFEVAGLADVLPFTA